MVKRVLQTLVIALCSSGFAATVTYASGLAIKDTIDRASDFSIVGNGHASPILVDKDDAEVVHIVAGMLASDIERVSGIKPSVSMNSDDSLKTPAIIIGTLGQSGLITDLINRGKLDVRAIAGQWESFVVATVADPYPGVSTALVIAGSDRRGTAYGVMTLSEVLGISPWEWWADVPPQQRKTLVLEAGTHVQGPPSVKYRGIFINDEDDGFQPWAAKTFEPETNDAGPKTYAKVCELLLRLKANYLWPAMHRSTKAFNIYPENKVIADRYAIVMGSSHAEPMLRNNVTEWTLPAEDWDYAANAEGIKAYWEQRVRENGRYENIYTLGMRGIHDTPMVGGGDTLASKVTLLQQVLADQRAMLARYVNPRVEQIPQIFVAYKEVLALYENNLVLPDDVTLVWPDDNYGYIRRLSTPAEQQRQGGAGVYYHISYWGKPDGYLWINTTPPALIWEEMSKAYDNGARNVWIVNVGDIKPGEIGMEFFLRMAWDITSWDENSQPRFLVDFAARNFGQAHAAEIASILEEYYRLNTPSKPEHLYLVQLDETEKKRRLERFERLVQRTNALQEKLRPEQCDAFYELVAFPVRGSAIMNEKYLGGTLERALKAQEQFDAEMDFYNNQLAGGKWRYMMQVRPRWQRAFRSPDPTAQPWLQATDDPAVAYVPTSPAAISFEAETPNRKTNGARVTWKTIAGLGRSGDSISLLPTHERVPESAVLEYDFTVPANCTTAKVYVYVMPTHALHAGLALRYSVGIDADMPQTVDLEAPEYTGTWAKNVLRAAAIGTTNHSLPVGRHTLKLRSLDPGLVYDKIVIDFE